MLPQEQPILLQKKPDDRYDTIIGVLLSLAMVAFVWHYAVKPEAKRTIAKSPDVETVATAAAPIAAETEVSVINRPVVIEPAPLALNTTPQEVLVTKPARVIVQTVQPKPVITTIKAKSKPVVVKIAPRPPVIAVVKPIIKPIIVTPPPPPAAIEPVTPKVIVRESIEFGNGSARLPPAATPRLLEIVELLKNDTRILKIVGHTDNIGSAHDNHVLSLKRAKAVLRFLVNSGVPAEHLTVEGAGPDSPIDDNATEEGRKRNRRIEITEQS